MEILCFKTEKVWLDTFRLISPNNTSSIISADVLPNLLQMAVSSSLVTWSTMMVVGCAPCPCSWCGSLSDLDSFCHPSGSPISVSSGELHTLSIYGVVLLHYVVLNGRGVQFISESLFFSSRVLISLLCSFSLTPYLFFISPV